MPELEILICKKNKIKQIGNFPLLKDLNCACNEITLLKDLPQINSISCYNNPIKYIDYFSELKDMIINGPDILISKKYLDKIDEIKRVNSDEKNSREAIILYLHP